MTQVNLDKKSRKPNVFVRWLVFGILIIFVEFFLLLCVFYINSFYNLNQQMGQISIYILIAIGSVIPFILYLLKLHKRFVKQSYIITFCLLIGIFTLLGLMPSKENNNAVTIKQQFTGDELLEAVNNKRQEQETPRLKKDHWACVAATIELQKNLKAGKGEYAPDGSFGETIKETKAQYRKATSNADYLPNFLWEFNTYGYNLEDTIQNWDENTGKLLFLDKKFTVGCAVTKDGYGVVVTAKESPKASTYQPDYDYSG
jgi:hypothetical protein